MDPGHCLAPVSRASPRINIGETPVWRQLNPSFLPSTSGSSALRGLPHAFRWQSASTASLIFPF
ncbi:hypothetical protein HAX54_015157, partial [Datura stramonium]|nr:hypothetical protein [Datura stramonium]